MAGKIYSFKVSIDETTYRVIEIRDSKSLYMLAMAILTAFDFEFDHAFGFYNDMQDLYNSDEIYELFVDIEDGADLNKIAQSVAQTKISRVFVIGKQMTFLFDYSDMRLFTVACTKIAEPIPRQRYPKIIQSVGQAPLQYPICLREA